MGHQLLSEWFLTCLRSVSKIMMRAHIRPSPTPSTLSALDPFRLLCVLPGAYSSYFTFRTLLKSSRSGPFVRKPRYILITLPGSENKLNTWEELLPLYRGLFPRGYNSCGAPRQALTITSVSADVFAILLKRTT